VRTHTRQLHGSDGWPGAQQGRADVADGHRREDSVHALERNDHVGGELDAGFLRERSEQRIGRVRRGDGRATVCAQSAVSFRAQAYMFYVNFSKETFGHVPNLCRCLTETCSDGPAT
jgi:hypothetical protein